MRSLVRTGVALAAVAVAVAGCGLPSIAEPDEPALDFEGGWAELETYLGALAEQDFEAAFELVCTRGTSATTWEDFVTHHEQQPRLTAFEVYEGTASSGSSFGRSRSKAIAVADVTFADGYRIDEVRPHWQSFGLCSMDSDDPEAARLDPTPEAAGS